MRLLNLLPAFAVGLGVLALPTASVRAQTPTPTAATAIRIVAGSAIGGPGDTVPVTVSLDAAGASVVATGNDLSFATAVLSLDPAACRVNPAIGKSLIASLLRSDTMTTTVRLLVRASQNTNPIPDGLLYTCNLGITATALPGTYRLANELAFAVGSSGSTFQEVTGADGAVTVSLIGQACAGDCGHDGVVTVDDIIRCVGIGLAVLPTSDCLACDADGTGVVTVDEIISAVNNALNGCVTPPTPMPTATPTPTPTPVRLFVRASGSDANSGTDPAHALHTISRAAQIALSGYEIVVGAGTYAEGVTTASTGRVPQALSFLADVSGTQTGDAPGAVLVDATGTPAAAGFKFSNSSGTLIDGFLITGGTDGGIVIKGGSNNFTVQNCIVFSNPGVGIRVQDSAGALIFNNLVYGNGGQGVGIVGQSTGSPAARILSNTIFGNGDRGITVGTSSAASPGALIRNNIVQSNGSRTDPPLQNIKVFTTPRSDLGYDEDFGLVFPPTYLPGSSAGKHDVPMDATFNFASGGDFHLRPSSPAINAGDALPPNLEAILFSRTTTGTERDTGLLDLGFHYLP